ncbi:MAG: hypothetical protein LC099_02690 [Anaerolineales bacterium]|nr:hypothetical protein [Anaerolineales bacterium]
MFLPIFSAAMILLGLGALIAIWIGANRQRAEERRALLASAETVEEALRAKSENDSYLQSFDLNFSATADGGLEISVNGEKFNGIASLPDEKLKRVLLAAVKEWNQERNR